MNPNLAVDNLRARLILRGKSEDRADEICFMAIAEINEAVVNTIADGVDELRQLGLEHGLDELVEDIAVNRVGGSFRVGTVTGKTDFSTPPFPMLPKLLSAGKTAKDGHKYQVIPIPDEKPETRRSLSLNDTMMQRKADIQQARQAIRDKSGRPDAFTMAEQYIQTMTGIQVITEKDANTGAVHFRTASEYQDANTDWVKPAKQLDLTRQINDINDRIEHRIEQDTAMIINKYEAF